LIIPGDLRETFHYLQLVGFILLVIGTLVYNEIVIIPFWNFDKYTKEALAKKQVHGASAVNLSQNMSQDLNNIDYISSSPHAAYDANRNQRILKHKMEEQLMDDKGDIVYNDSDNKISEDDTKAPYN